MNTLTLVFTMKIVLMITMLIAVFQSLMLSIGIILKVIRVTVVLDAGEDEDYNTVRGVNNVIIFLKNGFIFMNLSHGLETVGMTSLSGWLFMKYHRLST